MSTPDRTMTGGYTLLGLLFLAVSLSKVSASEVGDADEMSSLHSLVYKRSVTDDTNDLLRKALELLQRAVDTQDVERETADLKALAAKRKAWFWQPMGGPLPTQTRFVSFGSRLEPDVERNTPKNGIKAMRYGRRR